MLNFKLWLFPLGGNVLHSKLRIKNLEFAPWRGVHPVVEARLPTTPEHRPNRCFLPDLAELGPHRRIGPDFHARVNRYLNRNLETISMLVKDRKGIFFWISIKNGGEKGIRTLETLLEPTRFPGVRLRPLGHLSTNKNPYKKNKGPLKSRAVIIQSKKMVEMSGIEPLTFSLRTRRSPN